MKSILSAIFAVALSGLGVTTAVADDVYVNGYYKSNGTYVQPYYRTSPDDSLLNNYSTQGNVNPYTGEMGTKSPYGGNSYYPPSQNDSYDQGGFGEPLGGNPEPLGGYPEPLGN